MTSPYLFYYVIKSNSLFLCKETCIRSAIGLLYLKPIIHKLTLNLEKTIDLQLWTDTFAVSYIQILYLHVFVIIPNKSRYNFSRKPNPIFTLIRSEKLKFTLSLQTRCDQKSFRLSISASSSLCILNIPLMLCKLFNGHIITCSTTATHNYCLYFACGFIARGRGSQSPTQLSVKREWSAGCCYHFMHLVNLNF